MRIRWALPGLMITFLNDSLNRNSGVLQYSPMVAGVEEKRGRSWQPLQLVCDCALVRNTRTGVGDCFAQANGLRSPNKDIRGGDQSKGRQHNSELQLGARFRFDEQPIE